MASNQMGVFDKNKVNSEITEVRIFLKVKFRVLKWFPKVILID